MHKIAHRKGEADEEHHPKMLEAVQSGPDALLLLEKQKIRSAIGTDAILSAEVIVIALGAVATAPLATKALALVVVGLAMTIGVYGLVAAIVKVDDLGLHLQKAEGDGFEARLKRRCGVTLVEAMPIVMKGISVLGTVAMFAVGGGILLHGFPQAHHLVKEAAALLPSSLAGVTDILASILFGGVAGLLATPLFELARRGLEKLRGKAGPGTG